MTENQAEHRAWQKKALFEIMRLPTEVREYLLDCIVEPTAIRAFPGKYGKTPTGLAFPNMARAGEKKLRLKSVLVAIKRATFEVHSKESNEQFQAWLKSLDFRSIRNKPEMANGYGAVQTLSFPYFCFFTHETLDADAPNNDILLMRNCTNLRTVTLTWYTRALRDHGTGTVKTVPRLVQQYRLEGMLEFGSLGKLYLKVPAIEPYDQLIGGLAAWFRVEHASRGRKVDVVVT